MNVGNAYKEQPATSAAAMRIKVRTIESDGCAFKTENNVSSIFVFLVEFFVFLSVF